MQSQARASKACVLLTNNTSTIRSFTNLKSLGAKVWVSIATQVLFFKCELRLSLSLKDSRDPKILNLCTIKTYKTLILFKGGHSSAPSDGYCSGMVSGSGYEESNGIQQQQSSHQRISVQNQPQMTNSVPQQNNIYYQVNNDTPPP